MTEGADKPIETILLEAHTSFAPASRTSLDFICSATTADQHLGHAFAVTALRHKDRIAIQTAGGSCSYGDLLTSALSIRERLVSSHSFSPGARVLLLLPNGHDYIAAFYGTLLAGGVAVPLAPKVERQQFRAIQLSTRSDIVITQPRIARSWAGLLAPEHRPATGPQQQAYHESNSTDDELAAILFTGGSSGSPKGVMLSHRNLLSNAQSIQQYLHITCEDRPLCILPFYHAFGNSVLQSHLLAGSQLVIDGNTAFPETLIDAIAKYEVTSLSGVPDLFRFLLERTSLGIRPLPSLSYMAVAGGSLPHDLSIQVASRIAPRPFVVMYGQTEATARLAYVPPERLVELGPGCIGRAVPGVELEIVDETGALVPAGVVGEIRARGPNIMLGYWRDSALTGETIRDGWLYTGDLAVIDDAGWIYHKGRRNALIKVAGYRIHPSDVEEFIVRALPVQQAVLVPFEQPGQGTRLALYVRVAPEAGPLTSFEINACCRAQLPRHMVPDLIQFVDAFPLNDAMKIDRPKLITLAEEAAIQRRKIA